MRLLVLVLVTIILCMSCARRTLPEGNVCSQDASCTAGNVCSFITTSAELTASQGSCVAPEKQSGACCEDADCATGLVCNFGQDPKSFMGEAEGVGAYLTLGCAPNDSLPGACLPPQPNEGPCDVINPTVPEQAKTSQCLSGYCNLAAGICQDISSAKEDESCKFNTDCASGSCTFVDDDYTTCA